MCGPPAVVISGGAFQKGWRSLWPEAEIRATSKGSMTAELFCEFTVRWANHVRSSLAIAQEQALLLLLDSGGGSLIHLSPDFTIACEAKTLRPLYFPPYSTAAVCPADQDPNAQAERVWDQLRAKADSLTSFQALDIAHEVWDVSYGVPKYVQAGFAKCGLIPTKGTYDHHGY